MLTHKLLFIFALILILICINFNNKEKFIENRLNSNLNNSKNDFKIILFFTGGLCEEALNCIQSIDNIGLKDKLLVNTLDSKSFKCVKNKNININQVEANLKEEANFGTKDFHKIMMYKIKIIKECLEKYDSIILYSDTDIVFLNDITTDINNFKNSDYDIMFQNDTEFFNDKDQENLCAGFMILKPLQKNIDLCNRVIEDMKNSIKNLKDSNNGCSDQKHLNKLLKEMDINVGVLDLKDYPNGSRYFNNVNTIYKNYKPKIIHNNYIIGTKNKIERFKKHNLWFVD